MAKSHSHNLFLVCWKSLGTKSTIYTRMKGNIYYFSVIAKYNPFERDIFKGLFFGHEMLIFSSIQLMDIWETLL